MLTILDPTAEPGVPIDAYTLAADIGGASIRIGLLSNGFPDATRLLTSLGEVLQGKLAAPRIMLFERKNASLLASQEVLEQIASSCDVVVTAMGHCGSCTSSAVRDAVNIARRGVPVVALVTEKYWSVGEFVARSVGMPSVPRVRMPHPVSGTGIANINQIAEKIHSDVLSNWRGVRHD
jgi:hypothetical protein